MQDIATQIEALDDMTTSELADLYRELHGQTAPIPGCLIGLPSGIVMSAVRICL